MMGTRPGPVDPDGRPLLLVIATGPQDYREYLFSSLASRYRVYLLNTAEATWERPYLVGAEVVPDFAAATLIAAARRVAVEEPVAGVMSWDEARILPAAHVAADLGLPGGDPEVIERCRDKYLGRLALDAARVPQPRFALVGTIEEALDAAQLFGYPVILKPRAAAASYGVVLVRDAEDLADRFSFAYEGTVPDAPRHPQPVIVEEFVDGPEISVDSVVSGGTVIPAMLARKEIGFPPFFEETGHVVQHPDPLLDDARLRSIVAAAHAALGYRDGWTHAEFKLTPGGPKVIEVNGRLGGDLIPYLGMRASGIDPGLLAAAAACGEEVSVPAPAPRALVAGVRFFYVDEVDTVVESVSFETGELPATIDRAVPLAAPGSTVSPPPQGLVSGRIAFATAVASTADECCSALDGAQKALRLRVRTSPENR
jgi:biotin carboxylase